MYIFTSAQRTYHYELNCHQLYSLALPILFLLRLHTRAHPHVTVVSQLGMMSMLKNEACHKGTYRGNRFQQTTEILHLPFR